MRKQNPHSSKYPDFYLNIALLFLTIHLFTVNARLLAHLNVDSRTAGNVFDFTSFQVENIIAMVISLSYSIITAILIKLIRDSKHSLFMIIWFSLLDGMCVYIYYSVFSNFQKLGAIYYAIYTASIILAIGLTIVPPKPISEVRSDNKEKIANLRKEMYKRTRNLKYKGSDVGKDRRIMNLKSQIEDLLMKD
jgi:hypothetical protein